MLIIIEKCVDIGHCLCLSSDCKAESWFLSTTAPQLYEHGKKFVVSVYPESHYCEDDSCIVMRISFSDRYVLDCPRRQIVAVCNRIETVAYTTDSPVW